MGKNKYHRGRSVNGTWVIGDVKRTEELQFLIVEVTDRPEETFFGIIPAHTSRCFRTYHNLNEFYSNLNVNHSNTFSILKLGPLLILKREPGMALNIKSLYETGPISSIAMAMWSNTS
ncbi:hypothetical protein RF11_07164 [Thelohanellus kitauei]|uniref:ISXO2-like transposase domain-containing protein n=1 Tax=Thelohanellus kitauei TaxID=669202 RepID=A0A0C2IKC9_THEKT|nr:hypothetical protein RF11_07164 [Thelohanellus kitauei]